MTRPCSTTQASASKSSVSQPQSCDPQVSVLTTSLANLTALGFYDPSSTGNHILISAKTSDLTHETFYTAWVFNAAAVDANSKHKASMSPNLAHDFFGSATPSLGVGVVQQATETKPIMRSSSKTTASAALEDLLLGAAALVQIKFGKAMAAFDVGLNEMVGDGVVLPLEMLEEVERAGQAHVGGEEKGLDDSDVTLA